MEAGRFDGTRAKRRHEEMQHEVQIYPSHRRRQRRDGNRSAGGGIRGGMVHGATDDVGYRAVKDPQYISDLQATILRQVGLNPERLEVEIDGRPVRLIEKGSKPIWGILES